MDTILGSVASAITDVGSSVGLNLGTDLFAGVTPAEIAAGGLLGAGLGAGGAALTGGKIGPGALIGGLAGGLIPVGGGLGSELGIGTTAGEGLLGAAGGALGGALTGTSPLTGALAGGGAGLLTGLEGGFPGIGATPAVGGGGVGAYSSGDLAASQSSDAAHGFIPSTGAAAPESTQILGSDANAGTVAAGGGSGLGGLLNSKNLPLLLAAGALGTGGLKGNQLPELAQIERQAAELAKEGKVLSQPILTGVLPAGAQAAVDEAVRSNQAQVRSEYANLGLTGSTMEATALNEAALRGTQLQFQIAQSMLSSGLQATGMSNQLLTTIAQAQLQNDADLQKAIANFASALSGGGLRLGATG